MKNAPEPIPGAGWNPERGYIRRTIQNIATEARVGLHAWERHPEKPQRLVINVDLYSDDPHPHTGTEVSSVVDYDYLRDALRAWPARPHTELIETLVEEVIALCFRDARVRACRVSVMKPDIYNEASAAGVEIYRVRK